MKMVLLCFGGYHGFAQHFSLACGSFLDRIDRNHGNLRFQDSKEGRLFRLVDDYRLRSPPEPGHAVDLRLQGVEALPSVRPLAHRRIPTTSTIFYGRSRKEFREGAVASSGQFRKPNASCGTMDTDQPPERHFRTPAPRRLPLSGHEVFEAVFTGANSALKLHEEREHIDKSLDLGRLMGGLYRIERAISLLSWLNLIGVAALVMIAIRLWYP